MFLQTPRKSVLSSFALRRRRVSQGLALFSFLLLTATGALAALQPLTTFAAPTSTINFQARLETATGAIAPDGNYNVEFKLYNASTSSGSSQGSCSGDANCLWVETRTSANQVHVANGYLTVNLGSVAAFPSSIAWNQPLWLTMNIGGTGASPSWDGEMNPRLQLTAVPYAFTSGSISTTDGSGHTGTLNFPTSLTNSTDAITLPDASGTVCLQSSSSCGFILGSGTAFLQGGNSFSGTTAGELGTNNNGVLNFRTNNTDKLQLDTSGNLIFQQASTINVASAATGNQLTIQGGAATSGANNGGNLLLEGGAPASTGNPGSVIVQANTNDSTTAFQVQNTSGGAVLTADTKNMKVNVGGNLTVYFTPSCNYSSYISEMGSLSPTAWWKLEDTGSTAADSSGNGDTGTISGTGVAVNQTPGAFTCASSHPVMTFTGASSGNITTSASFNNPQTYTLNAIFKTSSSGPLVTFPGNVNATSAKLYVGSDGHLYGGFYFYRFCCGGQFSIISSTSTVNNGAWHMASLVVNASGEWLYLDGSLVASNTTSLYQGGNQVNGTGNWEIGGESNVWNSGTNDTVQYFTGSISQASVLGSLTGANIATLAGDLGVYINPNSYLGVNTASPAYPIDVVGDINTSTEYDIGGTAVCTSAGCTPAAGSNNYVQLQGSSPSAQTGYFNITGTGIAGILQAGTVKGTTTVQTPLLDTASAGTLTIGNTNATAIAIGKTSSNIATTITGTTIIKPSSGNDSTTAFQVQNAAGTTTLLNADSAVNKITINAGLSVNTTAPLTCNYSSYLSQINGASPTIYWKLEDASGSTATDSSGNSDNGSISATGVTLNQTPGPFACAASHPVMAFNAASSGKITGSTSLATATTFSLAVLFKTSSGGVITSFNNGTSKDITLYVGSDGLLYANVYNGSGFFNIGSTALVNDNNWHLAVMTYSSTSGGLKLYLDGNLAASNTSASGSYSLTGQWVAGWAPNNNGTTNLASLYFTGSVSQVAVIPSVISATAVNNLAQYAGFAVGSTGVGIGLAGSPSYLLDVGGDINTSTQYRIGGTVICTSSGCTPAAGSNNYVQLQGSSPSAQTGYFNITGTGIAGTLQAGSFDAAVAGVLTIGNANATSINIGSTTNNIATTINGTALIKPTSGHDSTAAFQVQNAAGTTTLLNADTANLKVSVLGTITNLFSATPGLVQVASKNTATTNPMWVAVQGKYAYVIEVGGTATLEVMDISNIASPNSVGTLALAATTPTQIQVQGHYAYITEQGASNNGVLQIVDLSNPHAPASVSTLSTGSSPGPFGVFVSGRYAYVINSNTASLSIVDVSNPAHPVTLSTTTVNLSPRKVYVRDAYAYVVSYGGSFAKLQILNVSNPLSPSIVGTLNLTLSAGDNISVQGNYAYITEFGAQLQIVDISNPSSPTSVYSGANSVYSYANTVSGRYLFTSGYNYSNSIGVTDVLNPSSPVLLQAYTTGLNQPAGMTLAGRYLFVANKAGGNLLIYDVSGLETTAATIHSLEAGSLSVDTNINTGGDVSVQGGLSVGGQTQLNGDLGVTGSASFATTINSATAFQIQNATGSTLLNADTANMRLGVNSTYAQMSAPSGLNKTSNTSGGLTAATTYWYVVTAIDGAGGETTKSNEISVTGASGYNLGWTAVTGASGYKVYRSTTTGTEKYLYSVSGNSFTDDGSVTISTTAFPTANTAYISSNVSNNNLQLAIGGNGTPTGQLYVSGTLPSNALWTIPYANAAEVYVQGNYMYFADNGFTQLVDYDVSNPAAPVYRGAVGTTAGPNSLAVAGDYAVTTNDWMDTISIINISNPKNPVITSTLNLGTAGSPMDVVISGKYAYVGDAGTGLSIVDISNPANPKVVGVLNDGGVSNAVLGSHPVVVQGKYVYIATNSATVQVVDVSNPANPTVVGHYTATGESIDGLYIQGRYLYTVSYFFSHVYILDVSDPTNPTPVSTITMAQNEQHSISVQGRYMYVSSDITNLVYVYDISNITNPKQIGTIGTGGSIFIQGRYMYLANKNNSYLAIYDLGGGYVQQLETGSVKTSTLQVDNNATVSGSQVIQGGLYVGQSAEIAGNFGAAGQVLLQNTTNSTKEFQIQNSSGANLLAVDSSNTAIVLGNDGTPSAITVRGGAAVGTNAAGANITFDASNGTGAAASGDLIFRTASPASASVSTGDSTEFEGFNQASLSTTFNVTSHSNMVMVVGVNQQDSTQTVTSISWNGSTSGWTKVDSQTSTGGVVELWYLVNPASGSHTLQVNFLNTGGTNHQFVGATTFYNVNQTTPIAASNKASSTGTSTSVSVTSTPNQMLVDVVGNNSFCLATPGGGQTRVWSDTLGPNTIFGGSYKAAASGSTTMTWSLSSSCGWETVAAALSAVAGSTSDVLTDRLHITAAGNIGINTATPQYTLDVAGSARVATSSTTAFQVQNSAGATIFDVDTSNSRIGLNGVTTPGATLDLSTSGTIQGAGLSSDCSGSGQKLLWSSTTKQFVCGTDRASYTAYKTADQSVSTTTLTDATNMTFPVGTNETWIFYFNAAMFDSNKSSSSYLFNVTSPTGSTCNYSTLGNNASAISSDAKDACNQAGGVLWGGSVNTVGDGFTLTGVVTTDATHSGNVTMQFARNAGTATITQYANVSYVVAYKVTGADLAEIYYSHDPSMQPGDIVAIDPSMSAGVKKTTSEYEAGSLGIISTHPGQVLGADDGSGMPELLALSGRVPVKVSTVNGPIEPGDYLTASNIPGVAMKATRPGQMIGKAMTAYDSTDPNATGMVIAFANLAWADPGAGMQGTDSFANLNVTGPATMTDLTVTGTATFQGNIVVNGHIVTGGSTPMATPGLGVGSGSICTVTGDDTSGAITLTVGSGGVADGADCIITFAQPFSALPHPVLMATSKEGANLGTYLTTTTDAMQLYSGQPPVPGRTYTFNYLNLQ